MWSLTSQRTSRISGPRNFRSLVKKDFFNTIGTFQTWRDVRPESAFGGKAEADFGAVMSVDDGGLNRSTQHFILKGKDGVWRWIRDFVEGLQRPRRRSYGIAGSAASRSKRSGGRSGSLHRPFISRCHRTWDSSSSSASFAIGADALGTRGDIERHCGPSIGPLDGWVAGPLALDGEPGNQPEWRLWWLPSGFG